MSLHRKKNKEKTQRNATEKEKIIVYTSKTSSCAFLSFPILNTTLKTCTKPLLPFSQTLQMLSLLLLPLSILLINLKLIRHGRLLAAIIVLIDSVQHARSSSRAGAGAEPARSDGREVRHCRVEVAGTAAELLAGRGSGGRGFLASLEFEEGFGLVWCRVFEEDNAAGGLAGLR